MSERRRIEARLNTLADIREIMAALRNTAVIEATRLRRLAEVQGELIATIERAAADFLASHPPLRQQESGPVWVFFGSERGFCGDFNHALLRPVESAFALPDARAIVVGTRLAALIPKRLVIDKVVEGPVVADDIPAVVEKLVSVLRAMQSQGDPMLPLALRFVHQISENHATTIETRKPFAAHDAHDAAPRTPLRMQLEPLHLLGGLIDHYLYAVLNASCHAALLAENVRRELHLDAAMRRIDTRSAEIARRRDRLRQEEITEEIELILLSADVPATRMVARQAR